MNLREIWRGTREEREAGTTFRRLNSRVEKGQSLSQSRQRRLEESEILSNRLTRRRIIIGGSSALAGSTLLGGGILMLFRNNEHGPITDFSPEKVDTNTDALGMWKNLPAQKRLQRLWSNQIPEEENFDSLHETVLASAEFYCAQVPCKFTPEELTTRTVFVQNRDEYLDLLIEHGNLITTNQDLSKEVVREKINQLSTGHTTKDKFVYLNLESIEENVKQGMAAKPDFAEFARNSNAVLKNVNYNLLHEYGHINESDKGKALTKLVTINFDNGSVDLTDLEGINVKAILRTNIYNRVEKINTDEALIEAQAFELCRRAGNDIVTFIYNNYDSGRQWISQLNSSATVGFSELAKYITGDLALEDLLVKWGSITLTGAGSNESYDRKLEKGLGIFTVIGLQTSRMLAVNVAYEFIVSQLSTQIQTVPLGPAQPR